VLLVAIAVCLLRPIESFSPPVSARVAAPPLLLPQANAKVIEHNDRDPYFMCPWGQYDLEWRRPEKRPPVLLYFPGRVVHLSAIVDIYGNTITNDMYRLRLTIDFPVIY
jgi:hypothetical protein